MVFFAYVQPTFYKHKWIIRQEDFNPYIFRYLIRKGKEKSKLLNFLLLMKAIHKEISLQIPLIDASVWRLLGMWGDAPSIQYTQNIKGLRDFIDFLRCSAPHSLNRSIISNENKEEFENKIIYIFPLRFSHFVLKRNSMEYTSGVLLHFALLLRCYATPSFIESTRRFSNALEFGSKLFHHLLKRLKE